MVTKTDVNLKITKVEGKIPSISGLATTSALTAVKNKIPDDNNLVRKTNLNVKITKIEGKIPSIIGLATSSALSAVKNKILDISGLITKAYVDAKLKAISDRVTKNKYKHLLAKNELKKLKK